MIRVSPDCSQDVQGTMTPASLQPAPYPAFGVEVPGAKIPYIGVPTWVARRSAPNFFENGARAMLYDAARQKTSASPVQPRRSSRWGQSVGTPTKFERWPQRMLLQS